MRFTFKKSVLIGALAVSMLAGATAASAATSYTVSYNDTMWKISQKYGVSLSSLIKANPQISNPSNIWPGLRINIPTTGVTTATSSYASQVVTLVNQERAKAGLKPLAQDSALSVMALDKAKDMYNNNYFSHTSPSYGSPFNMMNLYGIRYTYAGENIAKGQRTPQEVMNAWMNSSGHRQNILSPNYTTIGVSHYNGVWVQEFIAR
ncbi:SafA/ExsA family spore coat assembly protein [Paenibacillus thermotolerans]|uniref:SafA/ExsA family spore coat assembly protein n=1 Tax=Paenibacillus thermotolerans TaxID=3027807 RepID=UPI0023674749|nr:MULTISPECIES: SafA/ExsA family spore coat assembly protein [unclassified Paenibacillus]